MKYGKVVINNLPIHHEKYVVATLCNRELWFYGSYETYSDADSISSSLGEDTLVLEVE